MPGIAILIAAFFTNRIEPAWDWGHTINIAIQYATSGTTTLPSYVAAYANNRLWITVLIYFFKIILRICPSASADNMKTLLWALSDFLVIATVNLIYLSARCLFSEKKAFFTGGLAALYLPIYLYGQISYTDIPGLFLCSFILYLYCRLRQAKGRQTYLCLCFLGGVAAVAYKIKVLVFILVLAILIEEILRILSLSHAHPCEARSSAPGKLTLPFVSRVFDLPVKSGFILRLKTSLFHALIAVCAFGIIFGVSNLLISRALAISDEIVEEYEIPLTHWIMMGLDGNGGYSGDDYAFTTSISGYQAKVNATVSEIKERLDNLGVQGLLKHIFYKKLRRTWCKCMLGADSYISESTLKERTMFQKLFYKKGSLSLPVHIITSVYYFILMLGVFASGVFSFSKSSAANSTETLRSSLTFICRTTLIGFFLFESIWECNSRYLLCLIPVFMLTAGDGLLQITAFLQKILHQNTASHN
ncbi:MAG: glycosyltransferase family 39 protein [Lachnospiraceae bacterium]|nr:glycosyltransferase family 39 protein [Lachnospiraceae bacterium]